MMIGVKCPKCGLMQLAKENCESCGKKLEPPKKAVFPRLDPDPGVGLCTARVEEFPRPTVPPATREAGQRRSLDFYGSGGPLFGMFLHNTLLSILTAGIYSFWGKVRVRNYIWSKTVFEGDCFAYHGTGPELLVGFFKAVLFFGLPLALLTMIPRFFGPHGVLQFLPVLTYGAVLVFIPVAMVGARRYRLGRTSWRGILFSFRGRTSDFVKLFLRGYFLSVITLGYYYPTFLTRRQDFLVSHSYFGNQKFDFDGDGRDLRKPYFTASLLLIPTLGIYWFWFLARKERFFWEHTAFEGLRFRSSVTGGRLLALNLGNLLLIVLTLGLAWPWVMIRKIRFALGNVAIEGLLDPATIKQDPQAASATGEVLAGFMDAGFDLG
jgi:uncharacterized membrane protein YjgN (DUF898 family)